MVEACRIHLVITAYLPCSEMRLASLGLCIILLDMNSESLIKGGIAEHIVEVLFEQSGYTVMRIGREGLLASIPRSQTKALNQSDSAGKITTAPSFAVFDKKGTQIKLVKVKYRGEQSRGRNVSHGIKQLVNYWPEAILVLVTPLVPQFRVVLGEGQEVPIGEVFPQIKKETLTEGIGLVRKFL